MSRLSFLLGMLFAASPALAQTSVAIPEPGDAALFVLAVVGLIVGRQMSRHAPTQPEDDSEA